MKANKSTTTSKDAVKEGKKRMTMVKPSGGGYEEGSAEEEAAESPSEEAQEQEEGKGDEEDAGDEHVKVSPEFQSAIHQCLQGCSKQELDYARSCINDMENENRKTEMEAEQKKKGSKKNDDGPIMSTEGMPY